MNDQTLRRPRPNRRRARRSPRRVAVRALLVCLAAGPFVGLLWWLLAPGGLRAPGDTYLDLLQAAGTADAAFAVACLAAGAAAGIWWVLAREEEHDARAVGRLVGLLVGGLLAAVLAWCTGALLQLLVPVEVADVPAEVLRDLTAPRPNLAVAAGVLLWPLATGVLVLVDTLRDVAWQALREDRDR
ncbi:hypothetical protein [Aquipuribacter sp. MA13-6]|uniref:hypothetical protein n=1 Tax=unclassified Aquipuribacter TaxID=2635084 RepID=UPI003EEC2F33